MWLSAHGDAAQARTAHLFVAGDSVGANIAHKSGTSTVYFIEKSGSGGGEKARRRWRPSCRSSSDRGRCMGSLIKQCFCC